MIIFFGPAGAGKSVQGQVLAARQNWRWLSAGQLLRDTRDDEVLKLQKEGKLVPSDKIDKIVGDALKRSKDIDRVILDGFPRQLDQAKWLIENQPEHGRSIGLVVVLEVPRSEIIRRLRIRGRVDDTVEIIDARIKQYRQEMYPILSYLADQGVNIVHIDGVGTVGQIHDRIMEEIVAFKLVQEI
ncbi:nucleoside monophosphate kinase [Candidatus Saccharibacteria bacterium]|nr:nucleoside monophosphate kinase [Candidatus Saccharibacteria bacterium]